MPIGSNNSSGLTSSRIRKMLELEQSPAAYEIRLQALEDLSCSILAEVESLIRKNALLRQNSRSFGVRINLAAEVRNYEASLIRCALIQSGGNQNCAARLLGIKITTLSAKMTRYRITGNGLTGRA